MAAKGIGHNPTLTNTYQTNNQNSLYETDRNYNSNYYDDAQEYKPHHDDPQFTILIWFYKEPKKFTGGDFIFTQPNVNVKCKHNRMVLFPSYYLHQVTPVLMDKEYRNKGLGRFTITHFYWSHS